MSATDDRRYFIAAMIVFGSIAGAAVGLTLLIAFALRSSLSTRQTAGGAAHLVIAGPHSNRYTIAATFDVPHDTGLIHSEASLQYEVFYLRPRNVRIEAGVTRSAQRDDRLFSFIEIGPILASSNVVYGPELSEGPHRAVLTVDGEHTTFFIDDRLVQVGRLPGFSKAIPFETTVGTYVALDGERAAGTIADLKVATGGGPLTPVTAPCVTTTHGLALNVSRGRWELSGVNHLQTPPFRETCKGSTRRA